MFANRPHRLDFSDTRLDSALTLPNFGRFDFFDPLEQIAHADAAEHKLLRLVACAALATLELALASSLA